MHRLQNLSLYADSHQNQSSLLRKLTISPTTISAGGLKPADKISFEQLSKVVITTLLFAVFSLTNAYSAGDAEAIKKLSSFKKTGIDVVADVIDQNTKFRSNIEKNILC